MNIQYVVFAPKAPLSGTRWMYQQHEDGRIMRAISFKNGRMSVPDEWEVSECFPDALALARCLHGHKRQFPEHPEAEEIFTTLSNVTRYRDRNFPDLAISCLDGIIEDAKEWKRRLKAEVAA